jgi:hypothetical protein
MNEYRFSQSTFGKIFLYSSGTVLYLIIGLMLYEWAINKEIVWWGPIISIAGFLLFFKAKWSVIRRGKYF